jgi:hypothetical protein
MTLNGWVKDATRQVPGIVGCIIIVILFIRYVEKQDQFAGELADRCHESHQQDMREWSSVVTGPMADMKDAINANTLMLGQVAEALRRSP